MREEKVIEKTTLSNGRVYYTARIQYVRTVSEWFGLYKYDVVERRLHVCYPFAFNPRGPKPAKVLAEGERGFAYVAEMDTREEAERELNLAIAEQQAVPYIMSIETEKI